MHYHIHIHIDLPGEVGRCGSGVQAEFNDIGHHKESKLTIFFQAMGMTHLCYHLMPVLQINRSEGTTVCFKY